ncbi:MAG: hypothetical protein N2490_04755 [Ignavibacteria bacterium]|nr:hypothetical protein [Ignavibacteria bacterium]
MKLITDEILHLYFINPDLLDKDTLKEIKEYLLTDEDFINRYREIEKFHKIFREINSSEKFITLYPFQYEKTNNIRLAAAHIKEKKNEFRYYTSFISADNVVILRVQKNDLTNQYKLNLITDIPVDFKKVRINIGGYGKDIIPDDYGVAIINDFEIDIDTNIHINLGLEN